MPRRRSLCLVVAALLLLVPPLLGQVQVLGKIIGEIRVGRGEFPPQPIQVQLFVRGAPMAITYADGQGAFGFDNLLTNQYHIVINDEAYYPADEAVTVNPDFQPIVMVHIVLRPREEKKSDPLASRPSGTNPYMVDAASYNRHFPKKTLKEYQRGLDAEQKGKRDEAIAHYLEALKISPDYYPAHNNLGTLYLSKTNFKSAEEQFQDAVRLDPDDAQAYFNLGNLLMLTDRDSEADAALSSGLQRRPDSAFGHFLRGCLWIRTGKYSDAGKNLHQALQLDPTMWQAQLQLVTLYLQQDQRQNAIRELEAFLKTFPSSPAGPKAKELLRKLLEQKQ